MLKVIGTFTLIFAFILAFYLFFTIHTHIAERDLFNIECMLLWATIICNHYSKK